MDNEGDTSAVSAVSTEEHQRSRQRKQAHEHLLIELKSTDVVLALRTEVAIKRSRQIILLNKSALLVFDL